MATLGSIARVTIAGLALVGVGLTGPAPAAHATSSSSATCSGTKHETYEPGITNTPQPVHIHSVTAIDCVAIGFNSGPFAGGYTLDTMPTTSCVVPPLTPRTGTVTIHWDPMPPGENATDTTVAFSYSVTNINGTNITMGQGIVTDGAFAGQPVLAVITLPNFALIACAQPGGVTSREGKIIWQIGGTE